MSRKVPGGFKSGGLSFPTLRSWVFSEITFDLRGMVALSFTTRLDLFICDCLYYLTVIVITLFSRVPVCALM